MSIIHSIQCSVNVCNAKSWTRFMIWTNFSWFSTNVSNSVWSARYCCLEITMSNQWIHSNSTSIPLDSIGCWKAAYCYCCCCCCFCCSMNNNQSFQFCIENVIFILKISILCAENVNSFIEFLECQLKSLNVNSFASQLNFDVNWNLLCQFFECQLTIRWP